MIMTASDLLYALGGNSAVAALLKVKHNTVSGWRVRGLPAWTFRDLRAAASDRSLKVSEGVFDVPRPGERAA